MCLHLLLCIKIFILSLGLIFLSQGGRDTVRRRQEMSRATFYGRLVREERSEVDKTIKERLDDCSAESSRGSHETEGSIK